LLNNIAESFNAWLLEAREKPIPDLLGDYKVATYK
jgi:hypothetical protein